MVLTPLPRGPQVDIVKAACQGQRECTIAATNAVFGDPCGGTYKYLTINYQCN